MVVGPSKSDVLPARVATGNEVRTGYRFRDLADTSGFRSVASWLPHWEVAAKAKRLTTRIFPPN